MKVLRDSSSLYVRLESLYPSKHPEDMYEIPPDGNIFTQEFVELGIMPPGSGGKVYRLAANPVQGSRYDSVCTPDRRNRMAEDVKWNGKWEYAFTTNMKKGVWNQAERVWTAWFRIPFADLGSQPPATGEAWKFNAARNRIGRYMLWSDAKSVTDISGLGELVF